MNNGKGNQIRRYREMRPFGTWLKTKNALIIRKHPYATARNETAKYMSGRFPRKKDEISRNETVWYMNTNRKVLIMRKYPEMQLEMRP